jgi:hypothetical protein
MLPDDSLISALPTAYLSLGIAIFRFYSASFANSFAIAAFSALS